MSALFEELDYRPTRMGALSLRRRRDLSTGSDLYEIRLGEEFLMSSRYTASEIALAKLALAAVSASEIDVVVGGLGLGYTAKAVLDDARVRSLLVVEALPEVVEWHRAGLIPLGAELSADARCRLEVGDFFVRAASGTGFDPDAPGRRFHAVLADIDHSPANLLDPSHAHFYSREGLRRASAHLLPGGVFGLWSNDPPDEGFERELSEVFGTSDAQVVTFDSSDERRPATNTIYIGRDA